MDARRRLSLVLPLLALTLALLGFSSCARVTISPLAPRVTARPGTATGSSAGVIRTDLLLTHRFPLDDYRRAFSVATSDKARERSVTVAFHLSAL